MKLYVTRNGYHRIEEMSDPNNWNSEGGYDLIIAKDKEHASSLSGEKIIDIIEVDMNIEAVIRVPWISGDSPRED